MWPLASRMKSGTWTMEGLRSGARSWTVCVVETVPPQAQRSRAANELVFMGDSFRCESLIRRRGRDRCRNRGNCARRSRCSPQSNRVAPSLPSCHSMSTSRARDVYARVGNLVALRTLLCLRAASGGREIRQRRAVPGWRDPAASGRRRTGAVAGDRPLPRVGHRRFLRRPRCARVERRVELPPDGRAVGATDT